MGNGASMDNDGDLGSHQGQVQRPQRSRPPGSDRNTPQGSRAQSRRGSMASVSTWRSAFKSSKVPQSGLRKMRAAALGRKSACTVEIDKTGFTLQHIRICEGQVVAFEWEAPEGSQGFNVTQVIHDGEQYRPCIGGFNSGPLVRKGYFEQQFNLAGEYKFVSAGIRCTPLRVEVYPRKDIEGEMTDEGFEPKIIRIDEGNAVIWHWTGCSVPHTCVEVKFSHKLGTLVSKENADKPIPTKAGSFRKEFSKPGIFYFQTEGLSSGIMHTSVVHVRERQREFRAEILDRSFNPPILVIQEGDRVWFSWDKEKCQKYHCVYQVEAPPEDAHGDEAYKQYKNGFKWPNPSRAGLLSQEFYDVGVYHFSDHNFQEAAEYMGTIIVKPKQLEHFVEIKPDGFTQDLVYAATGDRIWWAWMTEEMKNNFLVAELEKCVSPVGGRPSLEDEQIGEGSYFDDELEQMKVLVGLESVQLASIGVYQYKISDASNTMSTCSIVVQGGPRNHTVHVTDNGFEPKVVTVHPGDRVWWVWQEGKKQHNISQVSHQGSRIPEGFTSGSPRDCPSAYMCQFNQTGVFYYVSSGVAKAFGAVVVSSHPKVHEIQAIQNILNPDPIVIALNDVVAWVFKGLRQHDVIRVHTVDQLIDSQTTSPIIMPRRCISRLFTETGVHHFTSKSFLKQNTKASEHRQNDETKVSSVLVDETSDSSIIRVSSQGFHPKNVNVTKGQSVLWTWKDSGEESHNIVHVNAPDSDKPLGIIQGSKSFNSGRPVSKNSFLYTFDEPGHYCVASQGAPGFAGVVNVLPEGDKTAIPEISSDPEGGMVDKLHTVRLECDTPDAKIYYTLDGTAPELHRLHPKLYNTEKGIALKNSGLTFVRAMAVSDGFLNSNIFTSGRFWVLSGDEDATSEASELPAEPVQDQTEMRLWWQSVPVMKGIFTHPGVMELFWDSPPQEAVRLIRGYQVFLNGISYCQMFPPNHNSVSVAGLAGGRMYEALLEVYPMDPMYLPHKSNKLAMKCPKTMSTGGPIISLETTPKEDTLAVVWMAISSSECTIAGYRVYLNGTMCGSQVTPDSGSDRCKVVIEGCSLGMLYRVVVAAIPEDGTSPKMSNEIQITLPQDVEYIRLPPEDIRLDDDDLYREYLEVREGAGYVPGEDGKRNRKKKRQSAIVEVQDEAHLSLGGKVAKTDMPQASAVPVIGATEGQDMLLPPPVITAEDHAPEEILVTWNFEKDPGPMYRVFVNVVNVVGLRFRKAVTSNISFECMLDENNDAVPAIQHCWNVVQGNQCVVNGLIPGLTYRIFVVANYTLVNSGQSHELQAKSAVMKYTTLGPPPPPDLKPCASDIGQATLEWEAVEVHKDVAIDGFRMLVDGKPLGDVLSKTTKKTTIDNLQPGKSIMVQVIAVTQHQVGDSEPSNSVRVSCPPKPPPVFVQQQPSFKKGTVIVGWEKPNSGEHVPYGEDVVMYRIFLDGKWHGEVKSSSLCNRSGYQYYLTDLEAGRSFDVNVKAYAGQRKADPTSDQLYSLVESEDSNTLPVMCPAPPTSPVLRLDGMHVNGIDIIWEMPQQYGDAAVSGYQLLRDSKLYGSIMPPDVNTLHIKDVSLGDRIQLQILALTDHPVGRQDMKDSDTNAEGGDSGIENSQHEGSNGYMEMFIGDRYSACKPGPKLIVHYTGLVKSPAKVWCERVTGHSAMIVWDKDEKEHQHFVPADKFQVTWWAKEQPDAQIISQSTSDDHLMLSGLRPNTLYSVVVEARKMQNYSDIQEGEIAEDGYGHTFILTGKSEALSLRTAKPPGSPGNLGIITTTCHSIQVAWDPPHESGIDILAIRVDAVAMKTDDPRKHSAIEVPPSASMAVVENLSEKAEYMISVTAVTEEFFENLPEGNDMRLTRLISIKKPPPEHAWLPSSSMIAMTSGTDPPSELRVIRTNIDSVTVTWSPAVVYGSNRLQGTVLRWAEAKFSKDPTMAKHKSLDTDSNEAVLSELYPGVLYRLVVEAVVSVKSVIDNERKDPESEKKNRRTTHVSSRPIFVRTRAPCENPSVFITSYSNSSITLYWEKPLLYSTIGKDEHGNPKCLKLSLEGYRLEINGKPHMRLLSTAQSCTLVKCKPGKTYKVVLVALSCTDEVKKERRKKLKGTNLDNSLSTLASMAASSHSGNKEWETTSEDLENDESASLPMEITLPESHDGLLNELSAMYKMPVQGGEDLGDLSVEWSVRGKSSHISQFNIKWVCEADGHTQKKVVNAHSHHTTFPVTRRKCVYDMYVEPEYNTDMVPGVIQKVQCQIPGPPDPPEIFIKSVGLEEFVIEWGEPRLFGIKVEGYQVLLNGKKVGGMLHSSHRKAVIPCKAKKTYKVSLVAVSADKNFGDSGISNTLLITPGGTEAVRYIDGPAEEEKEHDESDLNVKIVQITENSIHLEWTNYVEPEGMFYYKVAWTTVSQPDEREVKLPHGEKSCVLHKCLPGAKHHVRVWAIGKEDRVLDVSSQITVQTSAPPDTPIVTLRACNFRYIAIQWEKPSIYGDAEISGYKVYVNGVVEAVLGANQYSFMYTQGRWCREYSFQVQAVTKDDRLISKPSDPLVVTWPGVQAPVLRKVPAVSSNGLKVTWDSPQATSGVKIKHFKLVCLEEETEKSVQVLSPIHADTTEAELHNLKQGSYLIFLEVHVHGSNDVIRSDALKVKPTLTPDPPMISVTVIGLEERRRIERVTCDLINKRDRLLNFLHNRDMLSSMKIVDEDQVINKVTEDLTHVEDMLDDCLSSLNNYTGHLLIHVSWTCPQSNTDIKVAGYKVLVDGKQYGTMLHGGVKNVRIKLGLHQPTHKLTMIAISEAPQTTSALSNVVELLTETFQPFTFFMFLSNRPNPVGVSYQDALIEERNFKQGLINQGLMRRHVPPPACTLQNIFDGKYLPMFPHTGPSVPTAVLFWAKWNVASKKALGWFFRFAKLTNTYYDFIAVECTRGDGGGAERHDLTQVITDNSWRDDACMRHLSSNAADANGALVDAAELFGVSGTPLLMIVHPEGYIAWKGRFCAFDFATFENFMRFVMSQSLNHIASVPDPWDTNIDVDALDGVSKRRLSETQALIHRPTANTRMSLKNSSTHHANGQPGSAKKMFIKTNQHKHQKTNDQITVNRRPFSGSSIDSPYTGKLAGANNVPPRRVRSGKKVGKYY